MSKISIELIDVTLGIFKKGNVVVSEDRKYIVLVTKDKSSGDVFSGVCLYSISQEDRVGCYSDSWIASLFNGLFEGKLIIESNE